MSIQETRNELTSCLSDFDAIIESLNEDLERYQSRKDASDKFVYFMNSRINDLERIKVAFYNFMQSTSEEYTKQAQMIGNAKLDIKKLELICLQHGITDLDNLMREDYNSIKNYTQLLLNEKAYQLPFEIWLCFDVKKKRSSNAVTKTTEKPITSFKNYTPPSGKKPFSNFIRNLIGDKAYNKIYGEK